MAGSAPRTIIDKIWNQHVVTALGDDSYLLHIDRIFLHDRTGGRMLQGVYGAGRELFDRNLVHGTFDHMIDTDRGRTDITKIPGGAEFIGLYREYAAKANLKLIDMNDDDQGIVHVIAPELGIALPGSTFVCGDSHTCTVGGIGALAWGIGVTQGEHALTTQTLPQRHMKNMRIRFGGSLGSNISAKDLILYLIGQYGTAAGSGYAVEFTGPVVRAMGVPGRLTLCNMAVEFSAWTGIVAADDTTFEFLHGRQYSPSGAQWDQAVTHWQSLRSDEAASFDRDIAIDCSRVEPQVTWGTSPQHVLPVSGRIPDPGAIADAVARKSAEQALAYSGLQPGDALEGTPIEAAFIGSCTNGRLEDLRAAAQILSGRKVKPGIVALCVPGSARVKREAEAEGIDRIFLDAGFQWRESGCSLCFFGNGENFGAAKRVVTSTNRNFENRQGPGVRSHLASPATVAASAVAGHIADARKYPV